MDNMFDPNLNMSVSGSSSLNDDFVSNPIESLRRLEKLMSESNLSKKRKRNKSIVDGDELYVVPGNVVNYSYIYLRGLRDRLLLVTSQLEPDNPLIWNQLQTFSIINETLLELSKVVKLQDMVEPPNIKPYTPRKKKPSSKKKTSPRKNVRNFDGKLDTLLDKFNISNSGSLDNRKN